VIKTADWVIDVGPEGGARGGEIVAAGTPEQVAREARSYTGQFLGPMLAQQATAGNGVRGGGGGKRAVVERAAAAAKKKSLAGVRL
jgi:hypothetical protein